MLQPPHADLMLKSFYLGCACTCIDSRIFGKRAMSCAAAVGVNYCSCSPRHQRYFSGICGNAQMGSKVRLSQLNETEQPGVVQSWRSFF